MTFSERTPSPIQKYTRIVRSGISVYESEANFHRDINVALINLISHQNCHDKTYNNQGVSVLQTVSYTVGTGTCEDIIWK